MAKIYRRSDRIKVRIDDIEVTLSPLSQHQKIEVQQNIIRGKARGDIEMMTKGLGLALKYAVKDVKGIQDLNGNEYKLSFNNGELVDECVEDLMNMELYGKLSLVCSALTNGVPKRFTDSEQKQIDGVEIVTSDTDEKKN